MLGLVEPCDSMTALSSPFPGPTPAVSLAVISTSVRSTALQVLEEQWPAPLYYGSRTLKAARACWPYVWKLALLAASLWAAYRLARRRRLLARRRNVELSYLLFSHSVRFGLDIGGTLCKVVYFEPEHTSSAAQAALKARVSSFVRRSTSYGVTGRRDRELEVGVAPIRGTLHFLKFQTSMMPNFITIVRENELSPQRPLKDGGGSDELGGGAAGGSGTGHASTRGHHHHHPHHVHRPSSLQQGTLHPRQMSRSYSAAWRNEEEFRQSYLHPLPVQPQTSATPTNDAIAHTRFPSPDKLSLGSTAAAAAAAAAAEAQQQQAHDAHGDGRSVASTSHPLSPPSPASDPSPPPMCSAATTAPATSSSSSAAAAASTVAAGVDADVDTTSIPSACDSALLASGTVPERPPHSRSSTTGSSPNASGESSSVSCPSSPLVSSSGKARNNNLHRLQSEALSLFAARAGQPLDDPPSFSAAEAAAAASSMAAAAASSCAVPAALPTFPMQLLSSSGRADSLRAATKAAAAPSATPAPPPPPSVCATGGGAFKFESLFRDELHITLHKEDELRALVRGIDFMIHTCRNECYYLEEYRFHQPIRTQPYSSAKIEYPYLVVNIGSGVSILKVSGPSDFERVGGTSLGGGTFYGLVRALTGCTSFEEALQLAERGKSAAVDLLVGDIYGGSYEELGLPAETVAASFGKLVRGGAAAHAAKEDLAKAALVMITNNIGSLANLYARKVLNVPQMIFVGNFLNNNDIARQGLAFATEYWSKGQNRALFLTHEGYFGAVGSMLGGSK